ncbi:MAG TPA: hypothetical protein DD727_02345 [Clostridiales bacterium]|nr:hypothetical protein [Clostridiales bacterium]
MPVKTAVLGYGRSGSTLHAGPIEKLDDFQMTAVCDIDPRALEQANKRFQCNLYEDYQDMLVKEDLDLVVIVTRSHQHAPMAIDCMKAGKNVLVTKPWAVNVEEAREMIRTAAETGTQLLPWLPARWGCDLKRLRELVRSGIIGRVFQIRRSVFTFGIRHDWQTLKECGGGYLLNWGPHIVDQPIQLAGGRVKSVFAHMKQIINPGDVEDMFFGMLKTEEDITVVVEHNIAASGLPDWVVQGDRGTIFVRGKQVEVHKTTFPETFDPGEYRNPVTISVGKEELTGNPYGDQFEIYVHIARAVRGEEPYAISLDSALNLSVVLAAIRQSHETGETVRC